MMKRGLALLLTAGLLAGLTGCAASGEGASDGAEKVRLMVWSPSNDQSKDSGEWLQTMCERFADEASAAGQVSQDPEASADVFMFANDTLTTMTDANALWEPTTWLI